MIGVQSLERPLGSTTKKIIFFFLGAMLMGCNHLFYYPDNHVYFNPETSPLKFESGFIKTDDGEQIHYWDFAPQPDSYRGTILHFHGNAQNMSSHMFFVVWLIEFGYRVVTFDYRGYGQSSGHPSPAGLVKDGQAMIRWLCKNARSPLTVIGQSLGGAVAMPSITSVESHCIQNLVLESTFASYRDMARDKLASFFLTWPFQYPLSLLVNDDWAAIHTIHEIEVPTLVIHGESDPVVPFKFGQEIFDRLTMAEKEIWPMPEAGHTEAFVPDSPVRSRLIDYLSQWPKSGM
ncbi:alpha/beta hydrolase [Pseudobacteriovorax antillogorgiicola]|nr:alpha/beta hydrolase [Pseudobacteriovorax antillogorgiicola]